MLNVIVKVKFYYYYYAVASCSTDIWQNFFVLSSPFFVSAILATKWGEMEEPGTALKQKRSSLPFSTLYAQKIWSDGHHVDVSSW